MSRGEANLLQLRVWSLRATVFAGVFSVNAAPPDPKVLAYQLPDKIHWTGNPTPLNKPCWPAIHPSPASTSS